KPPHNAFKAYTEAGDVVETSKKFFSNKITQSRYLSEDVRKSVKMYEEKVESLKKKRNHFKNECSRIEKEIHDIESQLTKLSQDSRKLSIQKS
ncbi:hypothetical protein, partial [Salmonella sp. s55004]|uniref:hypothetical protein n=1 Tax=Salmonella sp. s55004 TaxID=3159675 RepID=UPI0039807C6F